MKWSALGFAGENGGDVRWDSTAECLSPPGPSLPTCRHGLPRSQARNQGRPELDSPCPCRPAVQGMYVQSWGIARATDRARRRTTSISPANAQPSGTIRTVSFRSDRSALGCEHRLLNSQFRRRATSSTCLDAQCRLPHSCWSGRRIRTSSSQSSFSPQRIPWRPCGPRHRQR